MSRTTINMDANNNIVVNGSVVHQTVIGLASLLLNTNHAVQAIRLVRYDTNLGLAEAKDFVDFLKDVRDGQTRRYSYTTDAANLAHKLLSNY